MEMEFEPKDFIYKGLRVRIVSGRGGFGTACTIDDGDELLLYFAMDLISSDVAEIMAKSAIDFHEKDK